jgi:Fur family ferric uptake transcriptional regulator
MSEGIDLIADLKARGIRITPQRAMILKAIEATPGHITVEEIYETVHRQNPYVNLTTVYRTLDLLRDLHLVSNANMGVGHTYFALRSHGTHHHAICRVCGHSFEFPKELLSPVTENLHQEYGFSADINHMVLFGLCQKCTQSSSISTIPPLS